MKVFCPPMGIYTQGIKKLTDYFGWDSIPPLPTTNKTIELGARYLNELMCLPAKVTLGNFIQACEQGATDLVMFDSCGQCRLKTYWVLQERALRKLGYNVTVHPIRLGKRTPEDIRIIDPSIPIWKSWLAFIGSLRWIYRLDKEAWAETPAEDNQVKIGIVGEIYTLLTPEVNKDLIKKITKMGAFAHNSLPLSYFVFKGLYNRGWMRRDGIDRQLYLDARKQAHKYFPAEIGGHGNESIIHSIYYGLKHFDGIIHVLPFPCMPESTVAPVLDDISRDYGICLLRLIFDTHTGEAGLVTRLEAFIDLLERRKAKIKSKRRNE